MLKDVPALVCDRDLHTMTSRGVFFAPDLLSFSHYTTNGGACTGSLPKKPRRILSCFTKNQLRLLLGRKTSAAKKANSTAAVTPPLAADSAPTVTFALTEGDKPVAAYAYCNLHGLWKTEV